MQHQLNHPLRQLAIMVLLSLSVTRLPAAPPATVMLDASRFRLLDGPFKQRQELHRTGRLGAMDLNRLLFPYRAAAGLAQPPGITGGYGGWDDGFIRGHAP